MRFIWFSHDFCMINVRFFHDFHDFHDFLMMPYDSLFHFLVDFGRSAIPFSGIAAPRRVVVFHIGPVGLARPHGFRCARSETCIECVDLKPARGVEIWPRGGVGSRVFHPWEGVLFQAAHPQARSSQRRVASELGAKPPAGLGCGGRHRAAENRQRGSRLLMHIFQLIIFISKLRLVMLILSYSYVLLYVYFENSTVRVDLYLYLILYLQYYLHLYLYLTFDKFNTPGRQAMEGQQM